ncbi:uncharacterized protein C8Q71DRAFT_861468 [Rhodofomes roseus]|uniref:Uncharacterized protein n=1 Tax=Rhodofomes roseus TaxID=34475 RepID=A0ABQ8K4G9_9APHY|nr:uncharacterized protein C8Q71DRAFT_861468 [Rhodofomes roseus]KAH9831788.1 hypothetical protein C8Q71DRAFT_861468 [Rhodofomes roseus]
MKKHAILALRNLLHDNKTNQDVVREIQPVAKWDEWGRAAEPVIASALYDDQSSSSSPSQSLSSSIRPPLLVSVSAGGATIPPASALFLLNLLLHPSQVILLRWLPLFPVALDALLRDISIV